MQFLLKNPKRIILAILVLLMLGIFWRFSTLLYFPQAGNFLEKETLAKLHPQESLQQSFIVPDGNLAKLEFIMRSPGIKPGDKVLVKILDAPCQKNIRQGFLTDSFLSSNNLYDFSFPIIPDSQNKTYCLDITFQPQSSTAKSLQFFYRAEDGSQFKNTSTGEDFPDQTLSLRFVYKNPSLWKNLVELDQRISQYKPTLLKSFPLALIASGFISLSLIVIIFLILL